MSSATCIVGQEALADARVELTGETFHHLFRVRRLSVGDELRLVDGQGAARWGRVESVASATAVVRLGATAPSGEASLSVEVWAAPPRPQRAAWLIEKATEVGVTAVRWIDSERAGRGVTPARLERLRRVAAAAVEQCQRSRVPEIVGPLAWSEVLDGLGAIEQAWFLDTASPAPPPASGGKGKLVLLVGPEGGWTGRECEQLARAGARPVSLGPRVLRVETAAVVGAALALRR